MTENTIPYATQVRTAGEVARLLARRRPKPALAAEREAMTVWRPFEDELLAYWLRGADAALSEGAALLKRYEALTAAHPLTGRHRDPRSPAAVLRRALLERVSGRELSSRSAGLVSRATASMVARHWAPGSAAHTRLRQDQARRAARPAHHELAALVSRRLARLDQDSGLSDVDAPVAPVTAEEARETGLPVGTPVPASVRALVATALRAPAAVLVQRGVATSAEDLAGLAGSLLAAELAPGHGPYTPDERSAAPEVRDSARAALRRLAAFGLESFPAADPTPRFLAGLAALAGRAGLCASFALEPYADNYTGTVTASVLPAARVSAELLHGTPHLGHSRAADRGVRRRSRAPAGTPSPGTRSPRRADGEPPRSGRPAPGGTCCSTCRSATPSGARPSSTGSTPRPPACRPPGPPGSHP
ncbi:hypothetical protein [Streptomyces sp. NBC_00347]|uniref:hypothetical protein n=1 Tax=Streptomyces sp. NBC_00347 TaxID=2975721 RepID=UPI002252A2A1|nr:hypothetical protein [Streptomyces sp. NBC_00347]MCX5130237.1 hypothetical protein [Streptomyces sp. NBC_00347]